VRSADSNHFQLIRSPTFNRGVQKVYKKINRIPDHEPKNGLGRTSPSAAQMHGDWH